MDLLEFGLLVLRCVVNVLMDEIDELCALLKDLLEVFLHLGEGFLNLLCCILLQNKCNAIRLG